jgi:hypothetical protein
MRKRKLLPSMTGPASKAGKRRKAKEGDKSGSENESEGYGDDSWKTNDDHARGMKMEVTALQTSHHHRRTCFNPVGPAGRSQGGQAMLCPRRWLHVGMGHARTAACPARRREQVLLQGPGPSLGHGHQGLQG